MDDLEHPALIEEWKKHLDAAAYEKYIYKDVKIPSIRKNIVMIKQNTGKKS